MARLLRFLTRREIEWHTLALTRAAIRRVLVSARTPREKLHELGGHLTQFGARFTNVATGLDVLAELVHPVEVPSDVALAGFPGSRTVSVSAVELTDQLRGGS